MNTKETEWREEKGRITEKWGLRQEKEVNKFAQRRKWGHKCMADNERIIRRRRKEGSPFVYTTVHSKTKLLKANLYYNSVMRIQNTPPLHDNKKKALENSLQIGKQYCVTSLQALSIHHLLQFSSREPPHAHQELHFAACWA